MCIFTTSMRLYLRFDGTYIRTEIREERERERERDETGQDLSVFCLRKQYMYGHLYLFINVNFYVRATFQEFSGLRYSN